MESKRFDEFVSGFYVPEGGQTVVAASGEGTIQVRHGLAKFIIYY
jgi:hypothetical protein